MPVCHVVRRPGAYVAVLLFALAGCTPKPVDPAPSPTGAPPTVAGPPAARPAPTPWDSPTPTAPHTQPLALVVHATRPVVDITASAARRVITDRPDRWSAIGQPGGPMRLVSFAPGTSARVLRSVRASREVLGILPAADVDPTVRVLTVGGKHPLRDPGAYALQVPAPDPAPQVTTLSIVGDVMLARRVGRRIAADPRAPFRPLAAG